MRCIPLLIPVSALCLAAVVVGFLAVALWLISLIPVPWLAFFGCVSLLGLLLAGLYYILLALLGRLLGL